MAVANSDMGDCTGRSFGSRLVRLREAADIIGMNAGFFKMLAFDRKAPAPEAYTFSGHGLWKIQDLLEYMKSDQHRINLEVLERIEYQQGSGKVRREIEKGRMPKLTVDMSDHVALQRVVSSKEAAAYCNVSVGHWLGLVKRGQAPAAVPYGIGKKGWRVSALVNFVDPLGKVNA